MKGLNSISRFCRVQREPWILYLLLQNRYILGWNDNFVCHQLFAMHLETNVCRCTIYTLFECSTYVCDLRWLWIDMVIVQRLLVTFSLQINFNSPRRSSIRWSLSLIIRRNNLRVAWWQVGSCGLPIEYCLVFISFHSHPSIRTMYYIYVRFNKSIIN